MTGQGALPLTRRAVLIGCATASACLPSAVAAEPLVLVFDATRFKLARPTRRSDFYRTDLFRGPRAETSIDVAALSDRFARREVALALVTPTDLAILQKDLRLALGVVA